MSDPYPDEEALAALLDTGEVAPCAGCGELFYANDLAPVDLFADDPAWLCEACGPLQGWHQLRQEGDVELGPAGRQALG